MENFYENMIIVDDDFLMESEMLRIENAIRSRDFTWSYINYGVEKETGDFFKQHGGFHNLPFFSHFLYSDSGIASDFFYLVPSILSPFLSKHQIEYETLLRARANLDFIKGQKSLTGPPHVDHLFNHYSFIYYLGDSDGDTVFFNKKYGDENLTEGLKEEFRITPKRGMAVLFDGNIFHASSTPTNNSTRTVINISFI